MEEEARLVAQLAGAEFAVVPCGTWIAVVLDQIVEAGAVLFAGTS